jgi:hypothetical protein
MTAHLFRVGTIVSLNSTSEISPPKSNSFVVEALMPPVGTSLQYRIKNESEGFSRVATESQLSASGSAPKPVVAGAPSSHTGEED